MQKTFTIAPEFILRTDNPGARVSSSGKGIKIPHRIKYNGVLAAIERSFYQTVEQAFKDAGKHHKIYLGDTLHVVVNVDRFGNVGTLVQPEYAIRQGSTIRSLLPNGPWPRHYSAEPCHLSEEDISGMVLAAIEQGVHFSYSIVRPRFGHLAGDILIFWPSHAPFYGAAAMDKLGECVDLNTYTAEQPFDPQVIHVGMPWLSESEFEGTYAILCGVGNKRLTVVNGGWYDGGVKKPISFQRNEARLPLNSPFVTWHYAMTRLRNSKVVAIGNTTAAGKTEGSSDEMQLSTPGELIWLPIGRQPNSRGRGESVTVKIGPTAPLITKESEVLVRRKIGSDDITAIAVDHTGKPIGVEIEPSHFNRIDLCTGPNTLEIAEQCVKGKIPGRIYYTGVGFDPKKQEFVPWKHIMLGTKRKCTNPRASYSTWANPDVEKTDIEHPMGIDYLMLSVPVPFIPEGWHMPTFLRLSVQDFLVQNLHGARSNKGNPALGEVIGGGRWAFEGYCGKRGFSLNTEALMFARDLTKVWSALNAKTPCFVVFNGYSAGRKQDHKYSGTFFWRALIENHHHGMVNAPLIKVPGVFTGGVPNLKEFLTADQLPPEELWSPHKLNPAALKRDAELLDQFCYRAMNRLLGQHGLGNDSSQFLGDLMKRYSTRNRKTA
jgi:hypothetical protein